jgi:lysophospholipase L1-like esterase
MKRLLTVGDSFTQGAELSDQQQAWPSILGQRLGYEVTNLGLGSGSNDYIFRTTINSLAQAQYDLVVVAWTHYARTECADEAGEWTVWPGRASSWQLFHPGPGYRQELIDWVTRHHNDHWLQDRWLAQIIALQAVLGQQQIPYVMCNAIGTSNGLTAMQSSRLVNTEQYMGWPHETLTEWAGDCQYGPRGHFLEIGHQRVAEKIYEYIRN